MAKKRKRIASIEEKIVSRYKVLYGLSTKDAWSKLKLLNLKAEAQWQLIAN